MLRVGVYARVSTLDQQTLPMQLRMLREYAARRGWTVAMQVKEVGSGAAARQLRQQMIEAARRRDIDVVLVWRLDRWGRSVADLISTLQELSELGVGFVSHTEALDLTTPTGPRDGRVTGRVRPIRTRDYARARAGRSGSCTSTRQADGPAAIGGSSGDRGTEAVPSRLQQIRNRPTAGHRPHLGAPIPGGIFLPDITCCLTALGLGAPRGALIRGLPRGYIPRWNMPARRLTQACRKDTYNGKNDCLYEPPGDDAPRKAMGVKLSERAAARTLTPQGAQEVQYEA